MRAVAVRRFGESALMTDLPAPGAEDSVLIGVSYAGVNPVDWQLVDQLTPNSPFPFVLGVDVAGLVEHVPAQETRLHVGDRVFGMARTHGVVRRVHRGADGRADRAAGAHSRQRSRRSGRRPSGGGDSRAGFAGTPRPRSRPAPGGDGGSRRSRRLRGSDGCGSRSACHRDRARRRRRQRSAPTGCRGRLRRRRRRRCPRTARVPPGRRRRSPRHCQWPRRDQARRGARTLYDLVFTGLKA